MFQRIALIAAAVGVIALGSGATFALFQANTSSAQNTFTAGTLTLSSGRDNGDPGPGPLFYVSTQDPANNKYPTGLWAPGDSHSRLLNVLNTGSLAGWISSVQASEITPSNLKDQLTVEVLAPEPTDPTIYEAVANEPLDNFLAGPVPLLFPDGTQVAIAPNASVDLQFKVTLNQAAGNAYQGKTEVVTFIVNGVQQRNNP